MTELAERKVHCVPDADNVASDVAQALRGLMEIRECIVALIDQKKPPSKYQLVCLELGLTTVLRQLGLASLYLSCIAKRGSRAE